MDRQSQQYPSPPSGDEGFRPGEAGPYAQDAGKGPLQQPASDMSGQYGVQPPQRLVPEAYAGEPDRQSYDAYGARQPDESADNTEEISWTASEFIGHQKTSSWYMSLGGVTIVVAGLIFLITRDLFSTIVVLIAGVLFGVAASRQPRELPYVVGSHALSIGDKQYPYREFRSFSVVSEGAFSSIVFMPLKRFAPPISIYYHPGDEQYIVEALADHLPMDTRKPDMTETLMRHIRF